MARPDMTLAVVGAIHPNRDGSNRLFEIALCQRGERITLTPDPKNPVDPLAVAVMSARGTQLGYLSAERCAWIGARLRLGEELRCLFQEAIRGGALIRLSFSGRDPVLPESGGPQEGEAKWEDGDFYPDEIPSDDFS
jgi:hypothetical protein